MFVVKTPTESSFLRGCDFIDFHVKSSRPKRTEMEDLLFLFYPSNLTAPNKSHHLHLSSRAQLRDLRCAPAPAQRSSVPLVRPQNCHPERSASKIYRVTQSLWRGVEGPRRCLSTHAVRSFSTTEARPQDLLRYALDGHGYIFSCTVIIFHPQVCARSLNSGLIVRMRRPGGKTVAGPPGCGLGG
jgi:hypothetical protein